MSHWIDKVLTAYRPLYLRGLLMDGQYHLPAAPKKPPESGKRVAHLRPAFEPDRRRVLVATATAAAVTLCTRSMLTATDGTVESSPERADEH
ncbi:hypothetical protein [Dyella caseinilytica]|uniref:Uncharacterized protein n=1 Tax=Dyella caseinilytica TaxID=1849581 RepID=A0ABX7GWY8_9GAMM|nr:hypothetical protein [Dyella caseinilytica]QRN53720.1 hypothetical protein ISN74_20390 [Dyella caseinilytica]GFZ88712.1 hypothetical protein GCM10011408_04390 [Dyella caseinilytica]